MIYAKFEYKGMELQITQTKRHQSIFDVKCLSSTPRKNEKIFMKCARNKRKSRHKLGTSKVLRMDRQVDGRTDGRNGPNTRPAVAKATQVKNEGCQWKSQV